jgi:hypothetical protein
MLITRRALASRDLTLGDRPGLTLADELRKAGDILAGRRRDNRCPPVFDSGDAALVEKAIRPGYRAADRVSPRDGFPTDPLRRFHFKKGFRFHVHHPP